MRSNEFYPGFQEHSIPFLMKLFHSAAKMRRKGNNPEGAGLGENALLWTGKEFWLILLHPLLSTYFIQRLLNEKNAKTSLGVGTRGRTHIKCIEMVKEKEMSKGCQVKPKKWWELLNFRSAVNIELTMLCAHWDSLTFTSYKCTVFFSVSRLYT